MNRKVIGVLKLNTNFPRLAGDIGNPDSFQYPVEYRTVTGAIPANVTVADALPLPLQKEFYTGAQDLIDQNVSVITTSCGFLITMQDKLASLSSTPVICSSLSLIPLLESLHGVSPHSTAGIGVLTFNRETLNKRHLGSTSSIAVEGLQPEDSLRQVIANDLTELDSDKAKAEVFAASDRLLSVQPDTRAIVLECTNLSPYKNELKAHTGMAVYDIVDAVHWLLESQP